MVKVLDALSPERGGKLTGRFWTPKRKKQPLEFRFESGIDPNPFNLARRKLDLRGIEWSKPLGKLRHVGRYLLAPMFNLVVPEMYCTCLGYDIEVIAAIVLS